MGKNDELGYYVDCLVGVFEEIRRVLKDDGTVWLNIGDVYTSGNRKYRAMDKKNRFRSLAVRPPTPDGLKPKDLIGLPWKVAFAMQNAGWYLRSEIIWNKPNAHPESVRDRATKCHETIFLLTKCQDYYYDVDSVRGPNGRRLRTVWDIPTEPRGVKGNHPAVMALELARRCMMITSKPNDFVLDPYAGSGTTLITAQNLGRRWVGVDISRRFVTTIQNRLK